MWSFGKKPEPRFRNRSARLIATTWHRAGAAGVAVYEPPASLAVRSWAGRMVASSPANVAALDFASAHPLRAWPKPA